MVGAFYAMRGKMISETRVLFVVVVFKKLWSTANTKVARRTQCKAWFLRCVLKFLEHDEPKRARRTQCKPGFFPCELCGSLCALCSTTSTTRRNDENDPAPRQEKKANCVIFDID